MILHPEPDTVDPFAGLPAPVTVDTILTAVEELKRHERVIVTPPAQASRIREALRAREALAGIRVVSSPAVPEGQVIVLNPAELRRRLEDLGARGRYTWPGLTLDLTS